MHDEIFHFELFKNFIEIKKKFLKLLHEIKYFTKYFMKYFTPKIS